ncbi:MAG: RNA methyltransferase [Planctomycetaceae bacterium]|nr:RNA methyltransferase [Planctomycetaceae bacterium]
MSEYLLSSTDDPRLDPYRDLKRTNRTRGSRHFIAEGIRVVERLLASDFEVQSVVVDEAHRRRFPEDLGERTDVFVLPSKLANELVGYRFHAGVLGCGERPAERRLVDWIETLTSHRLLVCCPRITDPENIGTIIRLCAGFGVDGLLVGTQSTDPFSRRSIRVSMGHAFSLPIQESSNLMVDLLQLRQDFDYEIVAVEVTDTAETLKDYRPGPRSVLLFGNESDGLSRELIDFSDRATMIPMHGQVDSLNVAISAAIVMHHVTSVLDL